MASCQPTEEAILQFLTIDNNGWSRLLFTASDSELSGFHCKTCLNICRDPSVIDCTQHKDDDIGDDMHCYQCLTDSIKRNNNKCLVNGHKNPTIQRIKLILNMIHKKIVLCPFSTQFKHINCEQNEIMQQIQDTPYDDQKEGENINANECIWKGSLKQLISKHFAECIRVNKPTFLLEIENKLLQTQNQSLFAEIQLLKESIPRMQKQHQEEIKTLEETISTLEPLKIEHQALKTENKTLKHRISTIQQQYSQMKNMKITNLKQEFKTEEKKDIDNKNDIVIAHEIKEHYVYYLYSSRFDDKRYLACDRGSKWIHQRNVYKSRDKCDFVSSAFAFVPYFKNDERYWLIRSAHENKWLSYGIAYIREREGNMVGLWDCLYQVGNMVGTWKLIPTLKNTFILQCFYGGKSRGYLGYQRDGKWNKLYTERREACIYQLSLAKYEDHLIEDGGIYAIQCNGKYISYETWDLTAGYCQTSSKYKLQDSSFKFIKGPQPNTWFIQNVYKDSRVHYWLSYCDSKWSLYKNISNRCLWRLLQCPQSMEFKIECIFNGKVVGWSQLDIGWSIVFLKPYKYSHFKLFQK